VMLRTVGVPARVAIGFTAGTDSGGYRRITTADAHAWVEAWFPGIGWTSFDPTPLTDGRTIVPPYVEEARADQAAELAPPDEVQVPDEVPLDEGPAPAPGASEQPPSATAPPTAPEDGGLPLWPFAVALLAVGAALVPATMRVLDRRRRMNAVAAGGPGAAAAGWAELLAQSSDRGSDNSSSDTVRAAARRLVRQHHLDSDTQQALRAVVGAVEASYYGGVHPGPGELDEPTRTVAAGIAKGSRLSLRGRLLPRSVLRRRRDNPRKPEQPEQGDRKVSPAGR
jgi:Transglutaminase-like superfamily